jgi:3-oxoacyl-[acyl-carrier protein] reductase
MMDDIQKSFKSISVLVNNSGVALYKLITDTTEQDWDKLFDVNVKSAFMITNRVLKGMISAKKGKIVNVSSMWGIVGSSMEVAYSASKSAIIGYTKALAKEVGPSGINVNCVCPGVIKTPMNANLSSQDMLDLADQTPLGRIGTPEEVGELVYFLSSDKADFITGQIISCDGGFAL